ncbi:MAG: hypothetical protein GY722_26255, partial [bacterium]|nr:hypothetical protein [bacterium]
MECRPQDPVNAVFADALGDGTILDDDVPALAVTKTDALGSDPGGDGEANPGDTVLYS